MKKIKPYLYTALTVLGILAIIFIVKGIFPFGHNSLIWGDMHDQITAYYYHFYDFVYSKGSLFYDFRIGGGIAFFGILAYYIISPLSLLVLLVPREYIYLMVSVIIAFKIMIASITCLYFIRLYFKKVPHMLQVLLAIIYAFSGYSLIMYQITPWIDAMYMFPLIMIGLKKVLDLEKPTFYIVTLTLSLIFSFYVSMMSVLFIFLGSIIYIFFYKKKEDRKKSTAALGVSTIISLLLSSCVVIPAYIQIGESSRIGFKMVNLINSKLGPITDKISMLLFGGLIYVAILLLIINYKEHKQFLKFYIPTLLLVAIPFIVEPINKVWHFGSYAFFPCRFGFITTFMLILGASYYLNNYKNNEEKVKNGKGISILISVVISTLVAGIAYKFSNQFQIAIHKLSLSTNTKLVIILMIMLILTMIGIYIILKLNKRFNTFTIGLISMITIAHIFSTTYLYLGMHKYNPKLTKEYEELLAIDKDHKKDDYYRIKSEIIPDNTITNSGLVTNYSNIDEFSSLTNKNTLESFKKMGFGSQWVLTYSRGSTLFMDAILGNKYLVTDKDKNTDFYTYVKKYQDINFYVNTNNVSFGFLINDNDTIFDKNNSFEIANSLYKNILDTEEEIFTIDNTYELNNIKVEDGTYKTFSIIDKDKEASFTKDINVVGRQVLYIEIPHSLSNYDNENLNDKFDLYVNGKLVCENCFTEPENGTYNLGTFEEETVSIKIVLKGKTIVKDIYFGLMETSKYLEFLDKYYLDTNITYNRNSIRTKVNGVKDKYLFLPINYSKDFKAYNNDKEVEIVKLYDNFVGIKLVDGVNDITIKYTPNDLIKYSIVSFIVLVLTIILIKTSLYNKLINNKIINNSAYYIYTGLNILMLVGIYVLLILVFLVSFIKYIRI